MSVFLRGRLGLPAPPGHGLGERAAQGARSGAAAVGKGASAVGRAVAKPFRKKPTP